MSTTSLPPLVLALSLSILSSAPLAAQSGNEIGFVEKFALAQDREKVLNELVPGSEDYYFYHALHYQHTRNAARLADIMAEWRKRFRDDSELRKVIENREALLNYGTDPQQTLTFLKHKFGLEFQHSQEARDKKPDLPSALDAARVTRSAFEKNALNHSPNLEGFGVAALESLIRNKATLTPSQRRTALGRIQRPDLPGLVEVIHADLTSRDSGGFGSLAIHRALTLAQLDALVKLMPELGNNTKYVHQRMRKLAPSADVNLDDDDTEREAWLDRTWAYAATLPPAFNTLKARILFHRLEHDRAKGLYDQERFLQYLKLPRQAPYVSPRLLEQVPAQNQLNNLNMDLSEPLLDSPPPRGDESLVRDYFLQLFTRAGQPADDVDTTLAPWTQYVRESWLKPLYAEAMILAGQGNPERWAALLTPTAYQQLKDRVDIEFPSSNARLFQAGEDIRFDVLLKNTPGLIVKIYEINQLNYFLSQNRQLNTDLNLDGLVANQESTRSYQNGPFLRKRETFTFPELKGKRGAWVIEFIGGGRSSRALVRVGQWQVLQRPGPGGDYLVVLDEKGAPVTDAVAWLDGRKLTPQEKLGGAILVPFTAKPGIKPVVLADAQGTFASLAKFEHHAEEPQFTAQFHLTREQLLAGREATLAVRPSLMLGGTHVAPSALLEPKLTLTTRTLDGITTTHEVKDLKLNATSVLAHTFVVPNRLAQVTAALSASVELFSQGGEKRQLMASRTWEINTLDKTDAIFAGRFSEMAGRHFFELLGKNGEPLADRQVAFTFTHPDFTSTLDLALRTDEKGRVDLGTLSDVGTISAQCPDGQQVGWQNQVYQRTWPSVIQAAQGETLRIPAPAGFTGADGGVSLLETRAGTFAADRSASATVRDGFVVVEGLSPGDYSLQLRGAPPVQLDLRISAGKPVGGWLLGRHRQLELKGSKMLQITGVTTEPDFVTVKLANVNPFTRVHVTATRFEETSTLFSSLGGFPRFGASITSPPQLPALYAAGREIGDEYRYILERRRAKTFAGSMLPRAELLLNPWQTRETSLTELEMATGQAASSTLGGRDGALRKARAENAPRGSAAGLPGTQDGNLDFLALSAPTHYNLVPDQAGVVRIPKKDLGDRQDLQIYAEDLENAVWQKLSLPEAGTKLRDERLTRNLTPTSPFTETKETTVLQKGQSLVLEDILTSEVESYDTLGGVYSLLKTLNADAHVAEFAWILQWPKFSDAEKRAKYGEHACHELHLFLAKKDPEFFTAVVKPYLANKKDKTFMDDFLLESKLDSYLEPWRYARLNVVERALLAQRLPGEAARAARHLQESWELLPLNPEAQDTYFETALRGRSLDGTDKSSLWADAETSKSAALALDSPSPAPAPTTSPAAPADNFSSVSGRLSGIADPAAPAISQPAARGLSVAGKKDSAGEELELRDLAEKQKEQAGRERLVAEAKPIELTVGYDSQYAYAGVALQADARQLARAYFRELGPAREWAENNYYKLRQSEQNATLVTVNAYWRDFAAWIAEGSKGPFVSPHVAEASRNFTEILLALAVLDLPFDAPKHATKTEGRRFEFTASAPVLVFHKQIRPAPAANDQSAGQLLVSQSFFRADERFRQEGNEMFQKNVTDEFLTGTVYGANIVVTNATSSRIKAEILLQIPQGALPVRGSKATQSVRLPLEPYTTTTREYYFYFPTPPAQAGGKFAHYPVHVATGGKEAGKAPVFSFNVVTQLSGVDKASWDYVSQYATDAEVFAYLGQNNIQRVDLGRIAWRCRQSADFYRQVIKVLAERHVWDDTLTSYALYHNDTPTLGEWLKHHYSEEFGPVLESPLVKFGPLEFDLYEHLEYSPLINQRAHRLGREWRIANEEVLEQYQKLLGTLSFKPTLNSADNLAVVYFLFLQDRVEEALDRLKATPGQDLATRIQLDYLRCQAAFYEGDTATARTVAATYRDHPVPRWKQRFGEVLSQLDEIDGKAPAVSPDGVPAPPDRNRQQGELSATEPGFEFKVENRTISLNWHRLSQVTVNYYLTDPEFSFSSNPFVSEDASRFSVIKPNQSVAVTLPADKDTLSIPLPEAYSRANLLVEIMGAGQRKTQAYHANTLKLAVTENYGRLEVRDSGTDKPIAKGYVKVYARLKNGTVRFFKDGYTDLRGRFDYASLNGTSAGQPVPPPMPQARQAGASGNGLDHQMLKPTELNAVEKLSILVLTDANGAQVREVTPPAQ
ncbi:hypothetical protein [Verrucomicrobium sp. BvORR106]|uniref:hypothetical protein n=1 Tax=Verrucomicrobium sp. BvORR106 TaxID=1403819 RepID=UPI000570B063|nr:hypothetical protein [Verrucomicrobium sp. BvORR106]